MESTNKRIIIALSGFVLLFIGLVLYMTYFQIVQANSLATNEYNKRLWVDENKVKRGSIYDRDGNILVETKTDTSGNNYRVFNFGIDYANLTGYNSKKYGKTGLEKTYTNTLLNISEKTPLSDLKDMIITKTAGNNINLTTNSQLQKLSYSLLEGKKGSIVMMNPSTGEIYAMSSRPSFNPNSLADNWDTLVNDESSPLLNRATQGLYAPGSVFKVITATGILENPDKIKNMTINDEGSTTISGYKVSNFDKAGNGETDLRKAIIKSSNVYFAEKGVELGATVMQEVAKKFLIGENIPFDLPQSKSVNGFVKGLGNADIATASFGQGNTLVTPLNMAMMTSVIANDGKMMKPYLVKSVTSPEGKVVSETQPSVIGTVTTKEIANKIRDYMVDMVDENGERAKISGVEVAGKSGTAEIKNKKSTHSWFVAFAPADKPRFAVAVVLEDDNTSGSVTAAPIARKMIEAGFDLIKK